MILVTVTSGTGTLARYECGGEIARMTHRATLWEPATFPLDLVLKFRSNPEDRFSVQPESTPPWHPPGTPTAANVASAA